jgi:hypothetical protein
MRGSALFLVLAFSMVGCGGKPAKDPSTETPKEDDTPKWEGASTVKEDPKPSGGGGGGASVVEGSKRREDQYDKEATEVVLKRAARQVKENCGAAKDETGKASGPWGKATLQIQLGHNGRSKGITVPSPYQGKAVGNCIEKAFANLTYPPWGGSDTQVDWEVELVQPGK